MNGPGIGELSLSRMTQGGRLHELWSKHGRQGPDWNLARIMIPRGQYKVGDERVSKIFIVNIYWFNISLGWGEISFALICLNIFFNLY